MLTGQGGDGGPELLLDVLGNTETLVTSPACYSGV